MRDSLASLYTYLEVNCQPPFVEELHQTNGIIHVHTHGTLLGEPLKTEMGKDYV